MEKQPPSSKPFLNTLLTFTLDGFLNPHLPPSILDRLPLPISHFLGYRRNPPKDLPHNLATLHATFSTFIVLLVVSVINHFSSLAHYGAPSIIPSFGAGAVLNLLLLDVPSGHPRATILGQCISSVVGVAIGRSPLHDWLAAPIAVALAVLAMRLLGVVHPPGGATAVLASTSLRKQGWVIVGLVTMGASVMVATACVVNNLGRRWPLFWWYAGPGREEKEVVHEKEAEEAWQREHVCPHCGRGD